MQQNPKLWGALIGLSLCTCAPALQAAEQLVFVSGAFRRSIPVADLDHLAQTGQVRGLLGDVLRFSRQKPDTVAKLLNQNLSLPLVLTSRLLSTRIGEALLARAASIFAPLRAPRMGVPALRSALILGLEEGKGSLNPIGFLKAYPSNELAVNVPALLALVGKASSISELVRFFAESPLDGLRAEPGSKDASSPSAPASPAP